MSKLKILIASPYSLSLRALRQNLQGLGHETAEVFDGTIALKLLRQSHYDLVVVTKLELGMTSFQLMSSIRTDPRINQVPVLFITKDGNPEDIMLATKCGAARYLIEPYRQDTLAHTIGQIMEKPQPSA